MRLSPDHLKANSQRTVLAWVAAVLLTGFSLSIAVYQLSRAEEEERISVEFSHQADIRQALARQIVDYYATGVYALKSLFEGSGGVSREEFRWVAGDILSRYPGIAALEWVAVVPGAQRATVEAEVAQQLGRPFAFTERGPDGAMVPTAARSEHFPILLVEPLAGNERAFGLDAKTAASAPYLEQARRSGQLVVTAQFDLVQGNRGIVMGWPVFEHESTTRVCRGFVQGVFRADQLLAQSHLRSPTTALDMLYIDEGAQPGEYRILYAWMGDGSREMAAQLDEAAFRRGRHREYPFQIGSRRWIALYRPTAAWLAAQRTRQPELWLGCGIAGTLLLAGLVASLTLRTAAITRKVDERTAELSESRRQLSGLLHALPGAAYRCSYDGHDIRVIYVSEGTLALTGYRADQFMSGEVRPGDLLHPDDAPLFRAAVTASVAERRDAELEFRIHPRSGQERWVLVRGRGVYDAAGRLCFFEGLALDVTARRQAEADKLEMERKLLESQKLESLGLLAGGIAHDFNNILTGIMGHANLARTVPDAPADAVQHLRAVEAGAARAAELCQQMLAYSGRGRFVVEPVDLNPLIREILPLLQSSLVRARLTLDLVTEPAIVMGDATQLRQVAINLLINAADALPPGGGNITVTTGRRHIDPAFLATARLGDCCQPGEFVVLEITDTGCGMDAATLSKIFDPFFTTKFTGRGLGLAAVLGIVRSHSGALGVRSTPGVGSTFTLALPPCREAAPPDAPVGSASPWHYEGRVLVIDDEPPVREIAAQMLRTFGFEVDTAAGGEEGIRLFRARPKPYDLVYLDLTMPGLDGVETLAQLRRLAPRVRVLLVSGYSENDRIAHLEREGPLVFLQKPFTRVKLEQKLREVLA